MVAEASQQTTLTPDLLCLLRLILKIPFEIISLKEMHRLKTKAHSTYMNSI